MQRDHSQIQKRFREALPAGLDFCSLRIHDDVNESVSVRQGVAQPSSIDFDVGGMVTVHSQGGLGYAATADLTLSGIREAIDRARVWAHRTAQHAIVNFSQLKMSHPSGSFHSPVERDWESVPLDDKLQILAKLSEELKCSDKIVDWSAALWRACSGRSYFTSEGGDVHQVFDRMLPMMSATANEGAETQTRTFGGMGWVRQQGFELLSESGFLNAAADIGREALQLLEAPNCPTGEMELLLAPDQMLLQIHESIGHPLELDRILGDERNYAGTSFVTLDMFGSYQYGSPLLNVSYDPNHSQQAASFAFDDDGSPAVKELIIKEGMLQRPLGGSISQQRASTTGVALSRADSWRRPPIDRMANLNVEPGDSSFAGIVEGVERGIYMRTNTSWSIDDSRNKFQFGCEWGQLIEDGQLTTVVKNPNYRGISASFWRSLKAVGDEKTFEILGTPYCGKGEPNQAVFVGHASPPCLFENIQVFGGDE